MRRLLWLSILACTTPADITDGVCGNGVLEPGEDCDSADATVCTASCRLVCTVGGTTCPDGSTCGHDNVCHALTGTFTDAGTQIYNVLAFKVTDIDGDGIGDVFGARGGAVEVRYGDATTPLARDATAPGPAFSGFTFGDIDGDGRDDMVIATGSGLFAFSTSTGVPAPVAFPARSDAGLTHERLAAGPSGIFTLDKIPNGMGSDFFQVGEVAPDLSTTIIPDGLPCTGATFTVQHGRALHPFVDGARTVVPLLLGFGAVCIDNPGVGGEFLKAGLAYGDDPNVVPSGFGETFLAQVLGDSVVCPDLLVPGFNQTTSQTETFVLAATAGATKGACTVTATAPTILPGAGFAAIQLALSTGAKSAVITSSGIVDPRTQTILVPATRQWRFALVVDLDGDGLEDFVTAGLSTDLEVFLQRPGSATPSFEVLPIATTDTVQVIVSGDYDGDGHGDIAFTTVDDTGTADLSIAWGGAPGGFILTDAGALAEAHDVASLDLLDDSLPPGFDHSDDLVIARGGSDDPSSEDPALLVAEYGSPSREITAPFAFRTAFGGASPLRASGVGALVTSHGVFAAFAPSAFTTNPPSERALVDLSLSAAALAPGPVATVAEGACSGNEAANQTSPCIDNAHVARMPLANGNDLVLLARTDATDAPNECMDYLVDDGTTPTSHPIACNALATSSDANAVAALNNLRQARVLDSDGTTGHLLLARGAITVPPGPANGNIGSPDTLEAYVWDLTVSNGAPQLANAVDFNAELTAVLQAPAGATIAATCGDVTDIELGSRVVGGTTFGAGRSELVVGCSVRVVPAAGSPVVETTQLWARYAADDGAPHYVELLDLGADVGIKLRAGDVTGDGLPDLVFTVASPGIADNDVHVLAQCDAYAAGCTGGE